MTLYNEAAQEAAVTLKKFSQVEIVAQCNSNRCPRDRKFQFDLQAPISNNQATQESRVAITSSSYTPFATTTTTAPTTAITTADISSTSTASPFSIPTQPPSTSLSTQQQQPCTTRKHKSSGYAASSR
ncbi:hypothetical protein BDB00DRAFT_876668 [Zychaea mexicana]|uniref:uncharacterized protein n=1 Tax=Zychaea mexicana TaxID=64656 RepID=UPI0022FE68D5|nr:uncharacterized protein BDB00DRAFT_876668 [Zychaea mexicana]KAI9489199.1 hypothetical protein BDB00DRAFT_876668 [Zychaea mexicana]